MDNKSFFSTSQRPMLASSSRLITIFYSNHSGNCKALLQYIKNMNLKSELSIKYVNIDNEIIKDVIMKKFTVVPAMTVVRNDEISLYTGENVFEWFNSFEASIMDQSDSENEVEELEDQSQPSISQVQNNDSQHLEESQGKKKTIMEIAAELSKARDKDKL